MCQLNSLADTEWKTFHAAKPKTLDVTTIQEFIFCASILVQKWQDRLDNYANFRQQSLYIVLKLGPSFEEGLSNEVEV
jgi:hypothetical protein